MTGGGKGELGMTGEERRGLKGMGEKGWRGNGE